MKTSSLIITLLVTNIVLGLIITTSHNLTTAFSWLCALNIIVIVITFVKVHDLKNEYVPKIKRIRDDTKLKLNKITEINDAQRLCDIVHDQTIFSTNPSTVCSIIMQRHLYRKIIPADVEIIKGYPAYKPTNEYRWGKDYTFCLSSSSDKFHRPECKYAYGRYYNAYEVNPHTRVPCKVCRPVLPFLTWVKNYNELCTILSKYGFNLQKVGKYNG